MQVAAITAVAAWAASRKDTELRAATGLLQKLYSVAWTSSTACRALAQHAAQLSSVTLLELGVGSGAEGSTADPQAAFMQVHLCLAHVLALFKACPLALCSHVPSAVQSQKAEGADCILHEAKHLLASTDPLLSLGGAYHCAPFHDSL